MQQCRIQCALPHARVHPSHEKVRDNVVVACDDFLFVCYNKNKTKQTNKKMACLAGGQFVANGVWGKVFVPPFGIHKLPAGADPMQFVGKVQTMNNCEKEYSAAKLFADASPEFGVYPLLPPSLLSFDRKFDDSDDPYQHSFKHEFDHPKEPLGELIYPLATTPLQQVLIAPDDVACFLRHLKCMLRFVLSAAQLSKIGIVHNDLHLNNIMVLGQKTLVGDTKSFFGSSLYVVFHPTAYKAIDLGKAEDLEDRTFCETRFAGSLASGIWVAFRLQEAFRSSERALHLLSKRHVHEFRNCETFAALAVGVQSLFEDAQLSFPVEAAAVAADETSASASFASSVVSARLRSSPLSAVVRTHSRSSPSRAQLKPQSPKHKPKSPSPKHKPKSNSKSTPAKPKSPATSRVLRARK